MNNNDQRVDAIAAVIFITIVVIAAIYFAWG